MALEKESTLPNVLAFKSNVQLKNEAELYIARTGNKMEFFKTKVGDFWIVVTTFPFSFLRKDCGGGLGRNLGIWGVKDICQEVL